MRFRLTAATDVGRVRTGNEDSFCFAEASSGNSAIVVVADGMGGAAAGEVASSTAVTAIKQAFLESSTGEAQQVAEWVLRANRDIIAKSAEDPEMEGMGTTCTALLLAPSGALLAQVGDSRAYRIRGFEIDRLTDDQSVWSDAVRDGGSPSAEYGRNHLTSALGLEEEVAVGRFGPVEFRPGDRFFLCSDGLWGYVTDPEILATSEDTDLEVVCRRLIDLANARGGADNITVAAAEVLDE